LEIINEIQNENKLKEPSVQIETIETIEPSEKLEQQHEPLDELNDLNELDANKEKIEDEVKELHEIKEEHKMEINEEIKINNHDDIPILVPVLVEYLQENKPIDNELLQDIQMDENKEEINDLKKTRIK